MSKTEEILAKIDKESSKMRGKSKTKMTDEEFRHFVTEQWALMDDDKYQMRDSVYVVGRMMNESVWTKNPQMLLKWIAEDRKITNFFNHTPQQKYNYYASFFTDGKFYQEGLAFFENEQHSTKNQSETAEFIAYFQGLIDGSVALDNNFDDDFDDGVMPTIELKAWQEFFGEEESQFGYTILDKYGDESEKENQKHKKTLQFLQENQSLILENILGELLKIYPNWQKRYDFSAEDKQDFMPDVVDIQGFAELLSPLCIYVHSLYKDGAAIWGVEFYCPWDTEHAVGVLLSQDKVLKIGDAQTAFNP
ncbi:MAG: hypothetical protein Q4C98_10900 [Capnocytophaga sp.]|nr:hypothetical protein [Capnocytophaga sp.]